MLRPFFCASKELRTESKSSVPIRTGLSSQNETENRSGHRKRGYARGNCFPQGGGSPRIQGNLYVLKMKGLGV